MANGYDGLGYDDFRRLAQDATLSRHEKTGFPNSYREGFGPKIFADIAAKLTNLSGEHQLVLEIGPGCSDLPHLLIDLCARRRHQLLLVDSPEMLSLLPDGDTIRKVAGFYPDCIDQLQDVAGKVDVILCYSVFHYIFIEASFWRFLDTSIQLLSNGGQMLIGDIPNVSKRKRFFASESGIAFHQNFMQTAEHPQVDFRAVETDKIDDAVIMGVVMRARAQGCDAYWLPQSPALPMTNRREDILIVKP